MRTVGSEGYNLSINKKSITQQRDTIDNKSIAEERDTNKPLVEEYKLKINLGGKQGLSTKAGLEAIAGSNNNKHNDLCLANVLKEIARGFDPEFKMSPELSASTKNPSRTVMNDVARYINEQKKDNGSLTPSQVTQLKNMYIVLDEAKGNNEGATKLYENASVFTGSIRNERAEYGEDGITSGVGRTVDGLKNANAQSSAWTSWLKDTIALGEQQNKPSMFNPLYYKSPDTGSEPTITEIKGVLESYSELFDSANKKTKEMLSQSKANAVGSINTTNNQPSTEQSNVNNNDTNGIKSPTDVKVLDSQLMQQSLQIQPISPQSNSNSLTNNDDFTKDLNKKLQEILIDQKVVNDMIKRAIDEKTTGVGSIKNALTTIAEGIIALPTKALKDPINTLLGLGMASVTIPAMGIRYLSLLSRSGLKSESIKGFMGEGKDESGIGVMLKDYFETPATFVLENFKTDIDLGIQSTVSNYMSTTTLSVDESNSKELSFFDENGVLDVTKLESTLNSLSVGQCVALLEKIDPSLKDPPLNQSNSGETRELTQLEQDWKKSVNTQTLGPYEDAFKELKEKYFDNKQPGKESTHQLLAQLESQVMWTFAARLVTLKAAFSVGEDMYNDYSQSQMIESINQKMVALNGNIDTCEPTLEEIQKDSNKIKSELKSLQVATTSTVDVSKMIETLNGLSDRLDNLVTSVGELNTTVTDIKNGHDDVQPSINKLNTEGQRPLLNDNDLTDRVNSLTTAVSTTNNDIDTLKELKDKIEEHLSTEQMRLDGLEKEAYNAQKTTVLENQQKLMDDIHTSTTAFDSLTKDLKEIQNKMPPSITSFLEGKGLSDIDGIKITLSEWREGIQSIQSSLDEINQQQIPGLDNQKTDVLNEINTLNQHRLSTEPLPSGAIDTALNPLTLLSSNLTETLEQINKDLNDFDRELSVKESQLVAEAKAVDQSLPERSKLLEGERSSRLIKFRQGQIYYSPK